MILPRVLLISLFCVAFAAQGAELEPASSIIADLESERAKAGTGEGGPTAELQARVDKFASAAPQMTPDEAANGWLELYEAWRSLDPMARRSQGGMVGQFDSLIKALPPPSAWEALQSQIAKSAAKDSFQDSLLNLFAATLQNDSKAQWVALGAIQALKDGEPKGNALFNAIKQVVGARGTEQFVTASVARIAEPLGQVSDQPDDILRALNIQLESMKIEENGYRSPLSVPNLVAYVGEKKATDFLNQAIKTGVSLQISGSETQALARKMALDRVDSLKTPLWSLVDSVSPESVELYQALAKKFPTSGPDDYERKSAGAYYFLSAIVSGKTKQADEWLADPDNGSEISLPSDGLNFVLAAGQGGVVTDNLIRVLENDPNLPLWGDLINLATHENRSGEALALARKAVANPKLETENREDVRQTLIAAALADNSVDEAVVLIREQIKELQASKSAEPGDLTGWALKLADLGELLKKVELENEGLDIALAAAKSEKNRQSLNSSLLEHLVKSDRIPIAQALVIDSLRAQLFQSNYPPGYPIDAQDALVNLAGIFDAADRPTDVLDLLEEAPWWGSSDLSEIAGRTDFRGVPVGLIAARALIQKSEKSKAVGVLKETVRRDPDSDTAYAMLMEQEGSALLPFLDQQFAENQFQERPLIWKAVLLLNDGNIDEADATIRQAIAIDPSDGEMGPGDRMRAYAVLADILDKQGKPDEAKVYRGAVAAIRLSEEADKYMRVGLLSRAIAMYKEALGYFADAYCIQSRLAVQLADLGDLKQAEEHYRRAYELMPDSFGRMESHCFGCERAFKGELAESLAEKTFSKMLLEHPEKPQLHYLMGYLRLEQNRPEEALKNFRKAVELDPDYINAWRKILSLDDALLLPNALRNEAALAVLRLDPGSGASSIRQVTDLKSLWSVVTEVKARIPERKPTAVLPLTVSATDIKNLAASQPSGDAFHRMNSSLEQGLPSPGELIVNQVVIEAVNRILTETTQFTR